MARPILFLSDYGLEDEFAGVCHAVIARIAPEARVIDLTHGIPPQDVLRAALTLAAAVAHAPDDAVYLAVVDPGVGTDRRPVVVEAANAMLVGPDNGLLAPAVDALGGPARAVEIRVDGEISATFHGRDVFAPAAARLAQGEALETLGAPIDPASLVRLEPPSPEIGDGILRARVIGVDRFGNVQLGARPADLDRAGVLAGPRVEARIGFRSVPLVRAGTFADVPDGQHGILTDSSGFLAIVRNGASAADALGLRAGEVLVLAALEVG